MGASKLSDQLIERISDDARVGATVEDIALANEISVAAFYRWIAIGRHMIEAAEVGRQDAEAASECGASIVMARQSRSLVEALARSAAEGRIATLRALDLLTHGRQAGQVIDPIMPSLSAIKLRLQLDGRLSARLPESAEPEQLQAERIITPRVSADSLRDRAAALLEQGSNGIAVDAVLLPEAETSIIAEQSE